MVRIIIEIDDNKNVRIIENKEDKTADLIVDNHSKPREYKKTGRYKLFNKKSKVVKKDESADLIVHNNEKSKVITNISRICPRCNNEFKPISNRQKYCSEACGMVHKTAKEKTKLAQKSVDKLTGDNQIFKIKYNTEVIKEVANVTVNERLPGVKTLDNATQKQSVAKKIKSFFQHKPKQNGPTFNPLIESSIDTADISDIKEKSFITPEQIKLSQDKPFSELRKSE